MTTSTPTTKARPEVYGIQLYMRRDPDMVDERTGNAHPAVLVSTTLDFVPARTHAFILRDEFEVKTLSTLVSGIAHLLH